MHRAVLRFVAVAACFILAISSASAAPDIRPELVPIFEKAKRLTNDEKYEAADRELDKARHAPNLNTVEKSFIGQMTVFLMMRSGHDPFRFWIRGKITLKRVVRQYGIYEIEFQRTAPVMHKDDILMKPGAQLRDGGKGSFCMFEEKSQARLKQAKKGDTLDGWIQFSAIIATNGRRFLSCRL